MNSSIFKLNLQDVSKGLVMAIITGAVLPIAAAVQDPSFSILSADWRMLGMLALNGAVIGFVSYLVKNFLTNEDGKFLGMIG